MATPTNSASDARFASQGSTAEDLLKSQTAGLVRLSDFRKRRVEAQEQKDREATIQQHGGDSDGSAAAADSPGDSAAGSHKKKKKKKGAVKSKLSFATGEDEDDDNDTNNYSSGAPSHQSTPRSATTPAATEDDGGGGGSAGESAGVSAPRRLGPNAAVGAAPRALTKTARLREAAERERLRKEFVAMQERVKAAEFAVPFVFFDGSDSAGGACRVRKGDRTWLFLEKSRKIGADAAAAVAGGGEDRGGASSRREWAKLSADDLMMVRGDIIVPHHYEFYYFIANGTVGPTGRPLFPYAKQPLDDAPADGGGANRDQGRQEAKLEGADEDPTFTKVVLRRWYERHKHIWPASVWEEFDPGKDYSKGQRKDAKGNTFFF